MERMKSMQYREVRDILAGYVEYIALMHGLDIKFSRNKKLNEFCYWVTVELGDVVNFDVALLVVEMGDVRNQIVMKFNVREKEFDEFKSKFDSLNYQFNYKYQFNTLNIFVNNIDMIHKVLTLFEEIGFFSR